LEQDSLLFHALVAWQGTDAKSNLFGVFNLPIKSEQKNCWKTRLRCRKIQHTFKYL